MSQYSMAYMYDWVRDMYDSDKWRWKVRNMSDNQIMAIFFRELEKREKRERNAKAKVGTDNFVAKDEKQTWPVSPDLATFSDQTVRQLTFEDVLGGEFG